MGDTDAWSDIGWKAGGDANTVLTSDYSGLSDQQQAAREVFGHIRQPDMPIGSPLNPVYLLDGAQAPAGSAIFDRAGAYHAAEVSPQEAPLSLAGSLKALGSGTLGGALGTSAALSLGSPYGQADATDLADWLWSYGAEMLGRLSAAEKEALRDRLRQRRFEAVGPSTAELQQLAGLYHTPGNRAEEGIDFFGRLFGSGGFIVPEASAEDLAINAARQAPNLARVARAGAQVASATAIHEGTRAAVAAAGGSRDDQEIGGGLPFTRGQKKTYRAWRASLHGGEMRSEKSATPLVEPSKHVRGVPPPDNEAHIDHKTARSKGGTNDPSVNAALLARKENLEKGDK